MSPPRINLPPYPYHEPPYPGSAFSLCHHGPPSRAYRDCEVCEAALAEYQEQREAWTDLAYAFWALGWVFSECLAMKREAVLARISELTGEAKAKAASRASCSWSAPRFAVLQGGRIDGNEVVWPDGERYPIDPGETQ